MREVTITEDEYYGGHWIITEKRSYYFPAGTTLEMAYNMVTDERR